MTGDADSVKEGNWSRRKLLAIGAAAGGALVGGYAHRDRVVSGTARAAEGVYRRVKKRTDTSLDGIPDAVKESGTFHRAIEDTFDTTFDGLDPEQKELIIDARYVEGEELPDSSKQYIMDLFEDRAGITVHWLDYPEQYSRDAVIEEYGHSPAEILWRDGGFYDEQVEDWLKPYTLQLIFAPGMQEGEPRGRLPCDTDDQYMAGVSAVNRAVIGSSGSEDRRLGTTLHEIAHLGNYQHNFDDPDDPGVFGQREENDLIDEQWNRIRDRLYMVNLEAPERAYDIAGTFIGCEDVVLPFE